MIIPCPAGAELNVAVTVVFAFSIVEHIPVPEHPPPLHPEKAYPEDAAAVRVTTEFELK